MELVPPAAALCAGAAELKDHQCRQCKEQQLLHQQLCLTSLTWQWTVRDDGIHILTQKNSQRIWLGCNRSCGTQQALLDHLVWPVPHKKLYLEDEKTVPVQWNFETLPVTLKSFHLISPLWMTWGFPWCFLFISLTYPLGTWDTPWLIAYLRMNLHLSLPLLIKSCLSYCDIPALFWMTRPTWQKYIIWGFTSKVPIVGEEFHTLDYFGKQLLFKSNVCKNCIPTLAPLTYF